MRLVDKHDVPRERFRTRNRREVDGVRYHPSCASCVDAAIQRARTWTDVCNGVRALTGAIDAMSAFNPGMKAANVTGPGRCAQVPDGTLADHHVRVDN